MKETNDIVELLTYDLNPDANVIWGARINDNFDGKVRVTAILTGVEPRWIFGGNSSKQGNPIPIEVSRNRAGIGGITQIV